MTSIDPTQALKDAAAALPEVLEGISCNQHSYKTRKKAFLYVGPGPKGVGYKAMFKLGGSMDEANRLSDEQPERYQVGVGNWVTTRFTDEDPLPQNLWSRWLQESYDSAVS